MRRAVSAPLGERGKNTMVSDVEADAIRKAIDQLKESIAELEGRLQQGRIRGHPGSLRSIAVRLLVSAERVESLVSAADRLQK